ncbi:M48 family metalloprotease [Lentzea sp. NPDC092896]|uniref:M48 family metalloprotease n=1 Tax=Lentzea sp. NPDC092896 TaxID=3364127 RepID=UPI0037F3E242
MNPARGQWWVYTAVAVALATSGIGAGEAWFAAHDLGNAEAVAKCLVSEGIDLKSAPDVLLAASPLFLGCVENSQRVLALSALTGAVSLLAAAWLLMIVGGLVVRWRVRPADSLPPAATALFARFDRLCDERGLGGRLRPQLIIALPATGFREAFTTALPGGRPRVVMPLNYAYADEAAFDAVVLHELAHVRARDITWASAAWWAGWLSVPSLLLALAPLFFTSWDFWTSLIAWRLYGAAVLLAVLSTMSVLVLRAVLLRRRETIADRYVVEVTGSPDALTAFLKPRPGDAPRRLLATHPSPARRLRDAAHEVSSGYGGFVFAAVVGIISMRLYHALDSVLSGLLGLSVDSRLPDELAAAVTSGLWAALLLPAWTRRAALPTPRWFTAWTGAVIGLTVGYCVKPPGATQITVEFYKLDLIYLVAALMLAVFAVVVLTSGVAARLTQPSDSVLRGRLSAAGGTVAVTAALTSALVAATTAATAYVSFRGDLAALRAHVLSASPGWTYAGPLLVLGLVLLTLRSPHMTGVVVPLAAGLTGGVLGSLVWLLRRTEGQQPDEVTSALTHERWLICAFAGLAAAVAVALAHRAREEECLAARVPLCILHGLLAAVLAGGVQYAVILTRGVGEMSNFFEQTLRLPGWLFVVGAITTLPLLLLPLLLVSQRNPRLGTPFRAGGAIAGTVVLTAALLSGALSAIKISERDVQHTTRLINAIAIPEPPALPASPKNPGRALSQTAATTALDHLPTLLPASALATAAPSREELEADMRTAPPTCGDSVNGYDSAERQLSRTAEARRDFTFTPEWLPLGATLVATVTSYEQEAGDLSAFDDALRPCSSFLQPDNTYDGGYLNCAWASSKPTSGAHQERRLIITSKGTIKGYQLTHVTLSRVVSLQHNQITVGVTFHHGRTPPPPHVIARLDQLTEDALASLLAHL